MVSITRILCPTDFSEGSRHALDYAAAVARWYEAKLALLHVATTVPAVDLVPSFGATGVPPLALEEADRTELVSRMRAFSAHVTEVPVQLVLQEAPNARAGILAQLEVFGADLLVMGSHGRSGFERALLGSVTERILRKASCPVLVVPPGVGARPPAVPFKRIICAMDFSDSSRRALSYALDLAQQSDAEIVLLHAIELPPELQELELDEVRSWESVNIDNVHAAAQAACLRRMRELVPPDAGTYCTIRTQVEDGKAHRQILRVAAEQEADLIVIGVHGRGAVDLLMFGSNTHAVLRGAECAVLTVRG